MKKNESSCLGFLVIIALIASILHEYWRQIGLAVCVCLIIYLIYFVISRLLRMAAWSQVKKISQQLVDENMKVLVRKRAQTVRTNDYGNTVYKNWEKEITYFINNVIEPELDKYQYASLYRDMNLEYITYEIIDEKVQATQANYESSFKYHDSMSPIDFEHFCANELNKQGWKAQVTKASGDQGVDVIAEKNNIRIVMQCKKYAKTVGNKAVQEIVAGKIYEHAQVACVITNSSYTKSAKELADINGVHLLHYYDLLNIDEIITNNG